MIHESQALVLESAGPAIRKNLALLSERLTSLSQKLGVPRSIPTPAFHDRAQSLPDSQLLDLQKHLESMIDQCQTAVAQDWPALDDLRLTWYAIRKLNLRTPDSLFSLLSDRDCIEIYDMNGVQMYRNFEFFRSCSYSVEELLTSPWNELFHRPPEILDFMQKEARQALLETREPFYSKIPKHYATETISLDRRRIEVEFFLISPLFGPDGKAEAFLASSRLAYIERSADLGDDKSFDAASDCARI